MKRKERKIFPKILGELEFLIIGDPKTEKLAEAVIRKTKQEVEAWIKNLSTHLEELRKQDQAMQTVEGWKDRRSTMTIKLDNGKKIMLNADQLSGIIYCFQIFFDIWPQEKTNGNKKKQ